VASAAALAALFAATACGADPGSAGSTTTSAVPPPDGSTTVAPTSVVPTTTAPTTPATETTTSSPPTTASRATLGTPGTPPISAPTTTRRTTSTVGPTTSSTTDGMTCTTTVEGYTSCVVPGRPLRRRRGRKWALLLPDVGRAERPSDEARAEYASVASFGELALRLLAVGAPARLVAACHRAALDEIRHASVCEQLAGRPAAAFGAIPGVLGHRLGGWRRSRRVQLQRLAAESFVDGWVNEGAAAAQLRERAGEASSAADEVALRRMADDEQRHADLARDIVTWCFDEEPVAVGRALAPGGAAPGGRLTPGGQPSTGEAEARRERVGRDDAQAGGHDQPQGPADEHAEPGTSGPG
jgi:hypothetical protein